MPPAGRKLTIRPLTLERWPDLEKLFGEKGACAGCWCMWWRQAASEFSRQRGEGNRRALKSLVRSGSVPGLLAYSGRAVVGWCAVEPRSAYPRLARARTLKPIDDQPVWSVTCFFVARPWRRKGITVALLEAAGRHAARSGATILEGYPVDTRGKKSADPWVFTGLPGAFRAAGFIEVARPSATRPIMRKLLE